MTRPRWTGPLLEPPSPDSVRDHLRLDPGRDGPSSVDAADVAVSRLLEELPVEFAAARLAGLVAPLQDTFMAALARWLEAEPEEIVETFYSTPLRARLAARALVVHGSGRAGAVGRHLALLAEALEDGSALFCAVLRWVVRETARRGDWQPLTSEDRAALAWTYADLLAATLLAAEVDAPEPRRCSKKGANWYLAISSGGRSARRASPNGVSASRHARWQACPRRCARGVTTRRRPFQRGARNAFEACARAQTDHMRHRNCSGWAAPAGAGWMPIHFRSLPSIWTRSVRRILPARPAAQGRTRRRRARAELG